MEHKLRGEKLCTLSGPASGAPCEPGEATTCTLSVAHGLGATRRTPQSVPGFHVVEFPFFLPNGETRRLRLESMVRVLAHQRGVVV